MNQFKVLCCGDALWVEANAGLFFYDFKTEMSRPSFPGDFFLISQIVLLLYSEKTKQHIN